MKMKRAIIEINKILWYDGVNSSINPVIFDTKQAVNHKRIVLI